MSQQTKHRNKDCNEEKGIQSVGRGCRGREKEPCSVRLAREASLSWSHLSKVLKEGVKLCGCGEEFSRKRVQHIHRP